MKRLENIDSECMSRERGNEEECEQKSMEN